MSATPQLNPRRRHELRGFLEQEAARSLREAPHIARRKRAVGLAAGAVGATALLGLVSVVAGDGDSVLTPTTAAAGVTFTAQDDRLVAEITDPEASAQEMTAAFAQEGLDITVILVPADAGMVGRVAMVSTSDWRAGEITAVDPDPGCRTEAGQPCPTAVEVPLDFAAVGEVAIGRTPHPGEAIVAESTVW